MNKEKRALNVFISNELYDSLKQFSFSNDDSMARTVSKALKQYMNMDIQRPITNTIEYPTIPNLPVGIHPLQKTTQENKDTPLALKQNTAIQLEGLAKEISEKYISLFVSTEVENIKKYLSTLSDDKLSILDISLSNFKEANIENPQKVLSFVNWANDILNPPTNESIEFYNEYKEYFDERYKKEVYEEFAKLTEEQQEIVKQEFEKGTKKDFILSSGAIMKVDFKYEWLPSIKETYGIDIVD